MNRRSFLRMAAAVPAVAATSQLPPFALPARAQQKEFAPRPGTWRTFEITTPRQVAAHEARSYGLNLEIVTYEPPSNLWLTY